MSKVRLTKLQIYLSDLAILGSWLDILHVQPFATYFKVGVPYHQSDHVFGLCIRHCERQKMTTKARMS
jgi:hypothetical protein